MCQKVSCCKEVLFIFLFPKNDISNLSGRGENGERKSMAKVHILKMVRDRKKKAEIRYE